MKWNNVQTIHVSLPENYSINEVGRLHLLNRQIYFEYFPNYINSGISISPFKLPLTIGTTTVQENIFEGLFGVFYDSLPDGFGRLLLDRKLAKLDIDPDKLTALDRLACVGKEGMGALCYQPEYSFKPEITTLNELDLAHFAKESKAILEGDEKTFFEDLFRLNGSSGGARPKILVGIDHSKKHLIYGVDNLSSKFKAWIIKFPSFLDPSDIGSIEFAYHQMAKACGIRLMPAHLFRVGKNKSYYGTQRFDRQMNDKFHVHSLSGLLQENYRLPSLDYESAIKATLLLTKSSHEAEEMFRIAVFNLFSHNRDDHGKNISFMLSPEGSWTVAPAYDLTFSHGPAGEHSTTFLREGRNPTEQHLLKLAEKTGLSMSFATLVIDKTKQILSQWQKYAEKADVKKASIKKIQKKISQLICKN